MSNPSLDEFEKMTALRQRRTLTQFEDKKDAMRMKKREEDVEKKSQAALKQKLYLQQNFTSELDIKDTNYPSVTKPGEEKPYQDAQTGPFDPDHWGIDGRWYFWHRYKASREAVPLKSLFK